MKRRAVALAAAAVALGLSTGAAPAAGSTASPHASCVGAITSFESSQLPPGSVGKEVSVLATSAPAVVGSFVRDLAREHGSIDACAGSEG